MDLKDFFCVWTLTKAFVFIVNGVNSSVTTTSHIFISILLENNFSELAEFLISNYSFFHYQLYFLNLNFALIWVGVVQVYLSSMIDSTLLSICSLQVMAGLTSNWKYDPQSVTEYLPTSGLIYVNFGPTLWKFK